MIDEKSKNQGKKYRYRYRYSSSIVGAILQKTKLQVLAMVVDSTNTDITHASANSGNEATAVAASSEAAVVPPPAAAASKPTRKVRRIVRKKKNRKEEDSEVVDPALLEKVMLESCLPKAYSFEIVKTLKRINQILRTKHSSSNNNTNSSSTLSVHIALQMPEGLLLYATVLSDVLERLVAATNPGLASTHTTTGEPEPLLRVSVLGDVTYGACCVDDLGAQALGCDLLVHYGHSCLVPIQHTVVPCLYVFVEITIDVPHLVECFHQTIVGESSNSDNDNPKPHVYLLGTIQFRHALMEARRLLRASPYEYEISIPQAKPLSPGEVLGCTSPVLAAASNETPNPNRAVVLFVADGRFHLESTMISNPQISKFYRYDPYPKTLTEESYDHVKMKSIRYEAIEKARHKIRTKQQGQQQGQQQPQAAVFGIILGTLGRQGNPALLTKLRGKISQHGLRSFVILASEITPSKLALFRQKVDAWVQIACPRLSVDWGHHLSGDASVPVLNPYELFCALDDTLWRRTQDGDESYPMDYYSQDGGPWSNYGDAQNKGREFTISHNHNSHNNSNAGETAVAAGV